MKVNQNLVIVSAVAALVLSGCSERRDCVDEFGKKRPDADCTRGRTGGMVGVYPRFIYGGSSSGGRITGGSTAPRSSYNSGGFGGRGSSIS